MEYLGIVYNKKSSRMQKDLSIEVDVEFNRDDIYSNVTFRFTSEDQSDFDARCERKIDVFIAKRQRLRTLEEVERLILEHIETVTGEMMVGWRNEMVDIKGAI